MVIKKYIIYFTFKLIIGLTNNFKLSSMFILPLPLPVYITFAFNSLSIQLSMTGGTSENMFSS